MRKVPPYLIALAVIAACAITGCHNSSSGSGADGGSSTTVAVAPVGNTGGDSGSPATDSSGGTSTAAGLLAYAAASLQSNCTDTGTVGHFPAEISGYTDSLACVAGPVSEVDYYQYASTSDMQSAYGTSSNDSTWGAPLPGGCASGSDEYGTWSTGGAAVGDISCPSSTQPYSLVWDDPNTNVIAVVKADQAMPSDIYLWWQSNGASIDGSSQSATSS
jgi:hypothetical protein